MGKEVRKSLRCPVCSKGRIADIPAGAIASQYRLFSMVGDDLADIIAKCPKCRNQIGISIPHRIAFAAVDAASHRNIAQN